MGRLKSIHPSGHIIFHALEATNSGSKSQFGIVASAGSQVAIKNGRQKTDVDLRQLFDDCIVQGDCDTFPCIIEGEIVREWKMLPTTELELLTLSTKWQLVVEKNNKMAA